MVFSPPRAGVTDISGATRHDWPDLLSQHGYGCETSLLTLLRSLPMSSPLSLLLLLPPLPRPPCNDNHHHDYRYRCHQLPERLQVSKCSTQHITQ